jgi:hypothetical protein
MARSGGQRFLPNGGEYDDELVSLSAQWANAMQ